MAKPKKGQKGSLAFHYAGLVSWEVVTIEKVTKDGKSIYIDGSDWVHDLKPNGTYENFDPTFGAKRVIHLDGGKKALDNAE